MAASTLMAVRIPEVLRGAEIFIEEPSMGSDGVRPIGAVTFLTSKG
jgi:hypothetical protein